MGIVWKRRKSDEIRDGQGQIVVMVKKRKRLMRVTKVNEG